MLRQIERYCGFARQTIQGKCQIQTGPRAGDLQAQRGTFGHSQRWDRTGDGLTARQLTFRAIERLQNLLKGKGRRDQQFELARLVETPVIAVQRPLKCLVFHRQRLAVAGVKRRERMRFAKRCADGGIAGFRGRGRARNSACSTSRSRNCAAGSSSGRASMSSRRLSASSNASLGTWKKNQCGVRGSTR